MDFAADGIGADGLVDGRSDAAPRSSARSEAGVSASGSGRVSLGSAALSATKSGSSVLEAMLAKAGSPLGASRISEGGASLRGGFAEEDEEEGGGGGGGIELETASGKKGKGGAAGLAVAKEKWHEHTVRMLHALSSLMTGPLESGGVKGGKLAGKKRRSADKAGDGLAAPPDGDLADVELGKGSRSDPLSFAALTDGAARRAAASSFFQLLVLKTWDVVDLEQDEAYGDIAITRTVRRSAGGSAEGGGA
jgi:hypothetical protein